MNLSKLSPNEFLDKLNNLFKLYTENSNYSSFNDMFIESCDDSTESKIKYLTATEFLERVQNIVNKYMSEIITEDKAPSDTEDKAPSNLELSESHFKTVIAKYIPGFPQDTVVWRWLARIANYQSQGKPELQALICLKTLGNRLLKFSGGHGILGEFEKISKDEARRCYNDLIGEANKHMRDKLRGSIAYVVRGLSKVKSDKFSRDEINTIATILEDIGEGNYDIVDKNIKKVFGK